MLIGKIIFITYSNRKSDKPLGSDFKETELKTFNSIITSKKDLLLVESKLYTHGTVVEIYKARKLYISFSARGWRSMVKSDGKEMPTDYSSSLADILFVNIYDI